MRILLSRNGESMSYIKRHIILILIIAAVLVCGTVFFLQNKDPMGTVESKLNIKLPSSSIVKNYRYNITGGNFDVKIQIQRNYVDNLKKQLDSFFGGKAQKQSTEDLPNFENVCTWWDLDKQNIEAYYMRFVTERKLFTKIPHQVWAFISKNEGQYYLYVSY